MPNLSLRESDVELFEDEPIEFIRKDLEGSDSDTRRRAATDFLRQLMEQFEQLVSKVVTRYIEHYLQRLELLPDRISLNLDFCISDRDDLQGEHTPKPVPNSEVTARINALTHGKRSANFTSSLPTLRPEFLKFRGWMKKYTTEASEKLETYINLAEGFLNNQVVNAKDQQLTADEKKLVSVMEETVKETRKLAKFKNPF